MKRRTGEKKIPNRNRDSRVVNCIPIDNFLSCYFQRIDLDAWEYGKEGGGNLRCVVKLRLVSEWSTNQGQFGA